MFDRDYLPFAVACLALVLSFLLMIAFHAGSDSSDVAAWVQAIGSIAAVLGAYKLGARDHALMMEERADTKTGHRVSVFYLLKAARESCERVDSAYNGDFGSKEDRDTSFAYLKVARESLERYQLAGVGSAEIVEGVVRSCIALQRLEYIVANVKSYRRDEPAVRADIKGVTDEIDWAISHVLNATIFGR